VTPRARLVRRLRQRVRVQRSFDVEPLGDGRERHTCRECRTVEVVRVLPEGTDPRIGVKLGRYRAAGSILGVCKTCSKRRAEERYPLPEDR
jgi:hypothetical protein